MPGIKQAMCVL